MNWLRSTRNSLCYSTIFSHRRQGAIHCKAHACCWRDTLKPRRPTPFHGAESDIGLSERGARQAERLAEYPEYNRGGRHLQLGDAQGRRDHRSRSHARASLFRCLSPHFTNAGSAR